MRKFSADVLMPRGAQVTLDRLMEVLDGLDGAEQATVHDRRSVSVRTKVSVRSWGEDVTCTIVPGEGQFVIHVESKSSVVTTLIDFGANRRNVERVVRVLNGVTE